MAKKLTLMIMILALICSCQSDLIDNQIEELLGGNWQKTESYMTLTVGGVAYNRVGFVRLAGSGTAIISWGDGTPIEQFTLSNMIPGTLQTHSYSDDYKQYTITIIGNGITHLYCGNNLLTKLDVSKNIALTELVFTGSYAKISSIDLSKNIALTKLTCANNQMTHLNLSNNTALTHLSCCSNLLTSLDLSKNSAIKWMDCENNKFQVDALNAMFNSLPTVDSGFIAIGRNPGATDASLNQSIAEDKGWGFAW